MFWNKKHKVQEGKETQILNIIKKLSEDEGRCYLCGEPEGDEL